MHELSSSAFGCTLLSTIGSCYAEHAQSELDSLSSLYVGFNQAGRSLTTGFTLVKEGVRVAMLANEVNKLSSKTGPEDDAKGSAGANNTTNSFDANNTTAQAKTEEKKLTAMEEVALQQKIEKLSGHMFAVMWYVTEMDIRSTLHNVTRKVTLDHSVSDRERILRCEAMLLLGQLFLTHGGSAKAGLGDIKSRLKQHMRGPGAEGKDSTGDAPDPQENANAADGAGI